MIVKPTFNRFFFIPTCMKQSFLNVTNNNSCDSGSNQFTDFHYNYEPWKRSPLVTSIHHSNKHIIFILCYFLKITFFKVDNSLNTKEQESFLVYQRNISQTPNVIYFFILIKKINTLYLIKKKRGKLQEKGECKGCTQIVNAKIESLNSEFRVVQNQIKWTKAKITPYHIKSPGKGFLKSLNT